MNILKLAALAGTAGLICSAASADPTLPLQKPGLWQQTMSQDGNANPNATSQICLDTAAEQKMTATGTEMSAKHCQSRHVARTAGGWSIDSVCSLGQGWTTKSHATVTGDFTTKVATTIDSTTTGAPTPQMNGTHSLVMSATWLGPCKPGQRGGDVVMGNGMKMNLLDEQPAPPPGGMQH